MEKKQATECLCTVSRIWSANCDDRGSFTELLKTANCGQFSVNISKPGITKGQHWHNSKWEFFIVVSGHGLIQERKIGTDMPKQGKHSLEAIELVKEFVERLEDVEVWDSEIFPYSTIEKLRKEFIETVRDQNSPMEYDGDWF